MISRTSSSSHRYWRRRRSRRAVFALIAFVAVVTIGICTRTISRATAQTIRTVPSCLDAAVTAKYGWAVPESATTIRRKYPGIVVEASGWSSSILSTYVAAFLIHEVLAIDVAAVEYPGQFATLSRLTSGKSDVVLEIWPNSKAAAIRELVIKRQLIAMYGALGYVGRISWYFPAYIADLYPNIIFSSWGSMHDPNLLQLLPRAGTTLPQRKSDGSYLCNSWYCQNGEYVPPQCQGAAYSTCREFWHVTPDYSLGMNEQRIFDFGLPLVIVYLGPIFIPTVSACIERQSSNSTCLFFYWVPEMLPSRYALQPVHFPPATFPCMAAFNQSISPSNATSWNCDWETDVLQIVATASIKQRVPPVHSLLLNFVVRDTDIVDMLSDPDAVELAATACAWTRENERIWRSWIPTPPSDYVKTLQLASARTSWFAFSLAVLALLVVINCISLASLVWFRSDPLIRIQSPALVAAVNVGALASGIGTTLDLVFADALSALVCTAKTAVSALGLGIVLIALLAKSWRVFYIFSNLRLSLVAAGRLFRLNVSNRHLALLGALILSLDALLISVWILAALPQPVQQSAGATTFTYRCGSLMDLEPATTVQVLLTGLALLYHWVLAGAGMYLAYRIRSLAMLNNESTVTMVAVAGVTLPTVFVIAIQVTSTNPFVVLFDSAIIMVLSLLIASVAMSLRPLGLAVGNASRFLLRSVLWTRRSGAHMAVASATDSGRRGRGVDAVGALTKLVNASLEDVEIETRNQLPSGYALDGTMTGGNIPDRSHETMAAAVRTVVTEWHGSEAKVRHSIVCRLPVVVGTHLGLRAAHAWWWTPWGAVTLVLIPPLRTLLVLDRDPWATHAHNCALRHSVEALAVQPAPPGPGQPGPPADEDRFLLITDAASSTPRKSVVQCRDADEARRWVHAITTTFAATVLQNDAEAAKLMIRRRTVVSHTERSRPTAVGGLTVGHALTDAGRGRTSAPSESTNRTPT